MGEFGAVKDDGGGEGEIVVGSRGGEVDGRVGGEFVAMVNNEAMDSVGGGDGGVCSGLEGGDDHKGEDKGVDDTRVGLEPENGDIKEEKGDEGDDEIVGDGGDVAVGKGGDGFELGDEDLAGEGAGDERRHVAKETREKLFTWTRDRGVC